MSIEPHAIVSGIGNAIGCPIDSATGNAISKAIGSSNAIGSGIGNAIVSASDSVIGSCIG